MVRVSNLVLVGVAAGLLLGAILRAQSYLNRQAELHVARLGTQNQPDEIKTAVTATGAQSQSNEPAQSPPDEISRPVSTLAPANIAAMSPPATQRTEPNARPAAAAKEAKSADANPQRLATPADLPGEGKKAVAIRVTNVEGIADFLAPDQHIDVVLTRQGEGGTAYNEVLAQNARILAIDQPADGRNGSSPAARSVMIQVDVIDAQKLLLASKVGSLAFILSKAGEPRMPQTRRVGASDLTEPGMNDQQNKDRFLPVYVFRAGANSSVYSVQRE